MTLGPQSSRDIPGGFPDGGRGATHQSGDLARTSGETAIYVQRLTGGEEFRGLAQLTARGFSITLCAVQVRVAHGYRCLPCVPFRNELEVDQLRVHRLQVLEPAVRADAVREVLALSAMLRESARRSGVLRASPSPPPCAARPPCVT